MRNNFELSYNTKYGNVFDIEDSIENTAEGDMGNLYFGCYSPVYRYYLSYFSCCNDIYIEGFDYDDSYDKDYWYYDRLKQLRRDINNCKCLKDKVNTMLDYMDEYSIYRIEKEIKNYEYKN